MTNEEKIKEIHGSPLFGIVIEIGAGQPVASQLFSVSGASKTVYYTESPYNSEYNQHRYFTGDHRAVSSETCQQILTVTYRENSHPAKKYNFSNNSLNFIFVSSFQVGDKNSISTHGWISFFCNNRLRNYHVSFHDAWSRTEYIEALGKVGIDIIRCGNLEVPRNIYIDAIVDSHVYGLGADIFRVGNTYDNIDVTLENFVKADQDSDFLLAFHKHKFIRPEEIFRRYTSLVINKGSFNPIHNGHMQMLNTVYNMLNNPIKIAMISLVNFDKGTVSLDELINRLHMLNEIGVTVFINKKPLFKDTTDLINLKFDGLIYYTVGSDTLARLISSPYGNFRTPAGKQLFDRDFPNVTFCNFMRQGDSKLNSDIDITWGDKIKTMPTQIMEVSSTQIRKLIDEKEYEKLKGLVPDTIIEIFHAKDDNEADKSYEQIQFAKSY